MKMQQPSEEWYKNKIHELADDSIMVGPMFLEQEEKAKQLIEEQKRSKEQELEDSFNKAHDEYVAQQRMQEARDLLRRLDAIAFDRPEPLSNEVLLPLIRKLMPEVIAARGIQTREGWKSNTWPDPYDPVSINEDFAHDYLGTDLKEEIVEVLPGGELLGKIDDMTYFRRQFYKGLIIPDDNIEFLNFLKDPIRRCYFEDHVTILEKKMAFKQFLQDKKELNNEEVKHNRRRTDNVVGESHDE